jgi:hypothetical protein
MPTPVQTERLVAYAEQLNTARHGEKEPIIQRAMTELGMSRAEVYRNLHEVSVRPNRKQRSDAGQVELTPGDAMVISGLLMAATRKNGKRIMTIEDAVTMLRANGKVAATRTTPDGEVVPLSETAIVRALRVHQLHPDQLNAPAPVTRMASRHPNHWWQIDASLCVIYYLAKPTQVGDKNDLRVMDHTEFYKNKPANVKRVENDTVWRYVITDHTSGWVFVHYVTGGETGVNLVDVFIRAICQRSGNDPVHGVPYNIMLDPGSANTGAVFKNLCRSLQVHVQINRPKNPRAKGQVEQGQNLVETKFESSLCLVAVHSLADLNEKAGKWMRWFNGTSAHSRHGMPRYAAWSRITEDQLRIAPPAALCRELAVTAPVERTVKPELTIEFRGALYKADTLPGVLVGDKVQVVRNPWRENAAQVVTRDEHGHETFYVLEPQGEDEWGFADGAPVMGESYSRHKDTPAQTHAKAVHRLVMGAATDTEAAAKVKAKEMPFNGEIDPYISQVEANVPTYLPKRGTASDVLAPLAIVAPLSHIKAAMALVQMGVKMDADRHALLRKWYPAGVPEADIEAVANRINTRPNLKVVGGSN